MMVSVIIPAYNRENTIKAAVYSILEQTYKELEVIVVDDCSTDGTADVVRAIEDDRVRLITCDKNGGACKARNIGIENAKGDVIAFQDSDDEWHSDKLEKSLKCMQEQGADFVFSALCREEIKKGKKISEIIPVFNLNSVEDKLSRILTQNYVSTQTIVAAKNVFETVRFDEEFPRFQDWDLAIQVIRKGFKVYYIEESLVESYVLGDSISYNGKKALRAIELLETKYAEEYSRNPAVYKRFCERAGYLIEMSGYNGGEYFSKAYKIQKQFSGLVKCILAKTRLYRPLNILVSKIK